MAFEDLAENLGLEAEEFQELVELFIETARADIDKLQEAFDNQSTEKAADAAHSLKGSSGNLGFMEVMEYAKTAEETARAHSLEGFEPLITHLTEELDQIAAKMNS